MRLIDADALIDKCGGWYVEEGTESGFIGTLKNLLATMPTIQPEERTEKRTETHACDLISRQAAIDAIENSSKPYVWQGAEIVRNLPPAKPEPHEGEWINTNPEYKNGFYNNSYYCSECHDYYTTSPYEMKFCPNCGAKMTISTK